jgi:hypothetical protein
MDIDITDFFNTAAPMDYSASVAEIGCNAGADTWRAACEDSADYMLLDTDEKRDAFRDYAASFGAWDREEIAAWSDTELNALLIQMISGDMREFNDLADGDWKAWEALCEDGTCSGRLYGSELSTDGRVYFNIGN